MKGIQIRFRRTFTWFYGQINSKNSLGGGIKRLSSQRIVGSASLIDVDIKWHCQLLTEKRIFLFRISYYTVMDIKDWTLHRAIEVKVP